jgi:hypothetical protein
MLTVSILPLTRSAKLLMLLLTPRAGRALRLKPFTPLVLVLSVSTLFPISCAKLLTVLLTVSTLSLLSYVTFDAYADNHQHPRLKLDHRRCRLGAHLIRVLG